MAQPEKSNTHFITIFVKNQELLLKKQQAVSHRLPFETQPLTKS